MASRIGEAAMQEARRARLDMGFGLEGPLPDLLEAIEGPGRAQVVVLELGDDIAGACLQRGKLVLLFVNGRDPPVRQRFTLAHEFGHRRLGHASVVDRPTDVFGRHQRDPSEVAANYFAAEFLMPGQAVRRWARGRHLRLDEIVRLAAEYGVSAKMARIRLETAGALRDRDLADRLDDEIDHEGLHLGLAGWFGWRDLQDTLAAVSPPRMPAALRNSALGSVLAGELTVARAAARCGRTAEEMRRALRDSGLDALVPPEW
jgi:Zn-dependent peptidase ImmA (M78 family)